MKLYGFLEPAQIEFDEAVSFYNHQREYLGRIRCGSPEHDKPNTKSS